MYNTFDEAAQAWRDDLPFHQECGVELPLVQAYMPQHWKKNFDAAMIAMDAQPALTTAPNSGIPAFLTTLIDPAVFKILFSPNKGAQILGEVRKGTWLDETAMFPTVEHTGEVSSYGDYNENGRAGVNQNWPQRQAYLFQTMKEYGERESERAGLGRINWVSEIDQAAASVLNKFSNLTYFFGVAGLQNYGLLNDPNLSASLTPSTKAAGGVKWIVNGVINASANEVYADIQALFIKLINQTGGLVDSETEVVLAMSPTSSQALQSTNSFGINVYDLLRKNYPNISFETAVQYGAISAANPQGVAGGELVQLIAKRLDGQETGYCSFNEKMRAHKIVQATSSWRQKVTGGTWGAIIRMPMSVASMLGV